MNTKPTLIEVTQADINNGQRKECKRCPIALAIVRKLPPRIGVLVDMFEATFFDNDTERHIGDSPLPYEAGQFVSAFDCTKRKLKPFSFTLDIPIV